MDQEIKEFYAACPECKIKKKTARRPVGHLPMRPPRSVTPWERVHVDGIGKWDFDVHIVLPKKTVKKVDTSNHHDLRNFPMARSSQSSQ